MIAGLCSQPHSIDDFTHGTPLCYAASAIVAIAAAFATAQHRSHVLVIEQRSLASISPALL